MRYVCKNLFSGAAAEATSSSSCSLQSLVVDTMMTGNRFYDKLGLRGFYSCSEVVALQPEIGVSESRDIFVTPGRCHEVIRTLELEAAIRMDGRSAGVLIMQPYSFAVALQDGMFLLCDSHGHGEKGTLVALIPLTDGIRYLHCFLQEYYSFLKFDGTVANVYAQLTLLKLSSQSQF